MRSALLGSISALLLPLSALADPLLSGAKLALTLGGKMLVVEDGTAYRFYASGLLEITQTESEDSAISQSYGRWDIETRYLLLDRGEPDQAARRYRVVTSPPPDADAAQRDTETASAEEISAEEISAATGETSPLEPIFLVMDALDGSPSLSGRLEDPLSLSLQHADNGGDTGEEPGADSGSQSRLSTPGTGSGPAPPLPDVVKEEKDSLSASADQR